jgi:hypothetical protein
VSRFFSRIFSLYSITYNQPASPINSFRIQTLKSTKSHNPPSPHALTTNYPNSIHRSPNLQPINTVTISNTSHNNKQHLRRLSVVCHNMKNMFLGILQQIGNELERSISIDSQRSNYGACYRKCAISTLASIRGDR